MLSPVAVVGLGKRSTKASSSRSPFQVSRARLARLASGSRPASALRASSARDPLIRTTASAAGGLPEDKA
jgi:hypothetical protein